MIINSISSIKHTSTLNNTYYNKKYTPYKNQIITDSFTKNISFYGNILHNNYDEWFKTYLKYSNEKAAIANDISKIILQPAFLNIPEKQIKILDIGCGNGELTQQIINNLLEKFPHKQINLDAFDINDNLLTEFKKRLEILKHKNLYTHSEHLDYFKSKTNDTKYDFLLASHVLYYTDNIDNALQKIFQQLKTNGKGIIVHHSGENCLLSKLRAKYNPQSIANLNQSMEEIQKNDIIQNSLEKQNIPYKKQKQYFQLNIPSNIKSNDFKNLISFLIDTPYDILLKENKINKLLTDIQNYIDFQNRIHLFNNMYIINGRNI